MQSWYSNFTRYWALFSVTLLVFCWAGQAQAAENYQVKEGDTLWSLAKTWNVSVEDIKSSNNLTGDNLSLGQALTIPNGNRDTTKKVSRGGYRDIVNLARNFLGIPYVSSGSNPRVGFDCSGFTQYVYSLVGVRLPRVAASQYGVGVSVPRNSLTSGDLIFFSRGSGISHVGIFVGGDNFIHASSSKGISFGSLSSSYWVNKYVGARRILN